MKKYRSILCILLAIAMVLVFCACNRNEGDEGDKNESTNSEAPSPVAESVAPSETAATNPATSNDSFVVKQATLILNETEYKSRPHEIQPGTVLNYVAPNDVPSQLPWNATSEGFLLQNIYEGLLYMYLGDVNDIRGCIAESWVHSDDFLTWTFQIRDGVLFTDGSVCDAPAFVKAWDYFNQVQPASFSNKNIVSWEATSAKEFVIHMSAPCAYFEASMCMMSTVSPAALDLYGTDDNRAAVGTAPYYIDSYTSGVSIVLKANPNYYLDEKKPCIETVNYQIIKDANTVLMALLNGDVDGAKIGSVETFYNLQDNGFDGYLINTLGDANPFWLNAKKYEPFRTFEVREAMCRFINFGAVNDLVFDSLGSVQDSMWSIGSSGYVQTDKFYYDPDEGQELLSSVGVKSTDLGFNSTILESGKDEFIAIQNELSKQGIKMEVQVIEAEANFTYLMNGDWTVTVGNTGYSNSAPYAPWTFILRPDALIKQCWQDVYNPELYQKMLDEYDAMVSSLTWDEMLKHCKQFPKGEPRSPLVCAQAQSFFSGALRASVTAGKKDKNTSGRGIHFPDRTPLPAPLGATEGVFKGGTWFPL